MIRRQRIALFGRSMLRATISIVVFLVAQRAIVKGITFQSVVG